MKNIKRKVCILILLGIMVGSLSACSRIDRIKKGASEALQKKPVESATTEQYKQTEEIVTEQVKDSFEEQEESIPSETEAPTEVSQTDSPDIEQTEAPSLQEIAISTDERYKINIFLSNFSEQNFCESYVQDEETNEYTHVLNDFDAATADIMELVGFAYAHAKINMNVLEQFTYDGYPYYGIPFSTIKSITENFFGRPLEQTDIQTGQWNEYWGYSGILLDGFVCYPAADGATYNNMTVVEKMYDLGDGTIEIPFNIYTVTDIGADGSIALIAGAIQDKSVYYFTPDDAESHPYFEHHLSGVAVVRPHTTDYGAQSYQLISYQLTNKENAKIEAETAISPEALGQAPESFTKDDLIGNWTVAAERTMEYNEQSLNGMFGRPYNDSMTFKENGAIEFYITYYGGSGEYELSNDRVNYNIVSWEDTDEAGTMHARIIDGTLYLVHEFFDSVIVFWEKK